MNIKITHPIIHTVARETTAYTAGVIYDVPEALAKTWIERGWAYPIQDKESPIGEPLLAAEVKPRRRRRAK